MHKKCKSLEHSAQKAGYISPLNCYTYSLAVKTARLVVTGCFYEALWPEPPRTAKGSNTQKYADSVVCATHTCKNVAGGYAVPLVGFI